MLSLLLEFAVYGLLAYGTVHYFGLEVDWERHAVHSRTSECQLGGQRTEAGLLLLTSLFFAAFTFHQFSQWLKMVTLPTMWLGVASLAWELLTALWRYVVRRGGVELCRAGLTALGSPAPQVDPGARVAEEVLHCGPAARLWHCHGGLVCDQPGG